MTMMTMLLFVLLGIVTGYLGFLYGQRYTKKTTPHIKPSRNYLKGINYLINEEPDKAVELFIALLDADSESIETHFTLGALFRRRGEVDRAIRIHQALIERPTLADAYRDQATIALARDYLAAGVLDRAERLLLQRLAYGSKDPVNHYYLIMIYQQEKDWENCIKVHESTKLTPNKTEKNKRAHYYCALAEKYLAHKSEAALDAYLKKAVQLMPQLPRIELLRATIALKHGQYESALKSCHSVLSHSGIYLPLVEQIVHEAFKQLDDIVHIHEFYESVLATSPEDPESIALLLADQIRDREGLEEAIQFLNDQVHSQPTIPLMHQLVYLNSIHAYGPVQEQLALLSDALKQSLDKHWRYQCGQCGYSTKSFFWACPSCHEWSSIRYEGS